MKTRLLTAAIALPLLLGSIILPLYVPETIWLFTAIAILALLAGLFEFYSMSKKLELKADASIGYLGAAALLTAFVFDAPSKSPDLLLLSLVLFFVVLLVTQAFRFQKDFTKMMAGTGVTVLGVLYVVFLGGYIISIRMGFEHVPGLSTKLLLFLFVVIFASDAGAYFTGKAIGKHKLVPNISPGKTWEGLAGGLIAAAGFAALSTWLFFPELPYKASIPLAIGMAAAGVFGDIGESALKRGSKTKDAANILPGHGGLLDRLDSLLFNAPILYYFARFWF